MTDFAHTVLNVFPKKRVAIIGDLVADQFLHGTIARVSREAPVFILKHDSTETVAGAAANAAVNVAALGGTPMLVGVTGTDTNGYLLRSTLAKHNVGCDFITEAAEIHTTTKVRVLAGQHYAARQQVIRIDYENDKPFADATRESILDGLRTAASSADAIVISDYNYGVATTEVLRTAQSIAREKKIPLLIDSRFRLLEFEGATAATPNQDEVENILGTDYSDADCIKLQKRLGLQALLITRGNKGMKLFEADSKPITIEAVGPLEPVDVTGAGDTVIATFALGLASGLGFYDAAVAANYAGGLVVMKKGTASVGARELLNSIDGRSVAARSEN